MADRKFYLNRDVIVKECLLNEIGPILCYGRIQRTTVGLYESNRILH